MKGHYNQGPAWYDAPEDTEPAEVNEPTFRTELYERLHYHVQMAAQIEDLLNALPEQMIPGAEVALRNILLEARPRY